ncbi:MAG: hypothetical protein WC421_05555 [Elusimicrobiales bacterium]
MKTPLVMLMTVLAPGLCAAGSYDMYAKAVPQAQARAAASKPEYPRVGTAQVIAARNGFRWVYRVDGGLYKGKYYYGGCVDKKTKEYYAPSNDGTGGYITPRGYAKVVQSAGKTPEGGASSGSGYYSDGSDSSPSNNGGHWQNSPNGCDGPDCVDDGDGGNNQNYNGPDSDYDGGPGNNPGSGGNYDGPDSDYDGGPGNNPI